MRAPPVSANHGMILKSIWNYIEYNASRYHFPTCFLRATSTLKQYGKRQWTANCDPSYKGKRKGWLPIAKLKPLVERYSCQPMRSLDTSNNLSVGPSCMWRTWNSWLCYLVSNAAGRRAGWEEQRDREKQGERGRAGEEQWKGRGKLLNLVIQVTGVE